MKSALTLPATAIKRGVTMGATEFLSAFTIVEQDHELVLTRMRALKETVSGLLDPEDAGLPRTLQRLRELHVFFGTQFESHMEEEEVGLFPLLEQGVQDGPELVARLQQEHEDLRRKCAELGNSLQVATDLEGAVPVMVLWDLMSYGWELWEALDNHAHAETQALYQCIARTLPGGDSGVK
jgi:hypothetical protein